MNKERVYRNLAKSENLLSYNVTVKETDLCIHTEKELKNVARDLVIKYRGQIESYIEIYPDFETTLIPWPIKGPAPEIVQRMSKAGKKTDTGPMSAVAGAIAEMVGIELLNYSKTVIVENGGDIFIKSDKTLTVGIYAGNSPVSMRMGLLIAPSDNPIAVCTSSGTIGHSLSFGIADAVCVVANSCFLADAAATSIGNLVQTDKDLQKAMDYGKNIQNINGIVIIQAENIAMWGDIELVHLNGKKC
ncbi:MAG: UPF0280 family protein [Desulfobacterales bacterium]|nr:UPF0280 family protein [Desulfobacterales bacterium]